MRSTFPVRGPRRQCGTTLLEALIAFLVLSLGMLAIARAQTQLRLNAELARQRSEAVRLAQEDIESLRAFAVLASAPGMPSFDAIASASRSVGAGSIGATNTSYRVARQIDPASMPSAKNLRVTVDWVDRSGAAQQVALASVIAGTAPSFSGALGLARRSALANGAFGRSVRIPIGAQNLGNGSSALKPVANGTVAFVFDNLSGQLTGRCNMVAATITTRDLTLSSLGPCDAQVGQLLSGVVRFSSAATPDAAQANDAPLGLSIALALSGGPYPMAPICSAEPVTTAGGERFVAYHCAVYPSASGRWSGRATVVPTGWTIGVGAGDRRVCRYSADLDGNGAIDANIEHPASYIGVDASLPNQNFLVVNGDAACPAGHAVPLPGNNGVVLVDLSTVQHQP